MKFSKIILPMFVLCSIVPVYAKDKKQQVKRTNVRRQGSAPRVQQQAVRKQPIAKPVTRQTIVEQPALVTTPPVVVPGPKVSMESYLNNRVSALEQELIIDIFPRKNTIERIILEFKDEYPGPNKEADTALIYDAIMKNPEIKKMVTLENATQVYKFLKQTISDVWDKQDELIWSR